MQLLKRIGLHICDVISVRCFGRVFDMEFAIPIAMIAGVAVLIGVIIWTVHYFEKKRTAALSDAASEIGLEFSADKDEDLLERMQVFSLFNRGHSRKMKNVLKAETETAKLTIFDYLYTTGGGNSSQTHAQSVVAMESASLNMPNIKMRPEGFFDRIGSALGYQDIDFDSHAEFSKSFVLQGQDEGAVREFFDNELLDFFTGVKGICVESAPGVFIFFRGGGRRKPEQIRELMDEGFEVYNALTQRMTRD